jgi:hypothetical protein
MEPARPLRDVFAGLAEADDLIRDPGEVLTANGHGGLTEPLVAEAVVSYADTAPHEVAEHLAPFVQSYSAVPVPAVDGTPEPDWFGLLATAPTVSEPAAGPDVGMLDLAYGRGEMGHHLDIEIDDPSWEPAAVSLELPEQESGLDLGPVNDLRPENGLGAENDAEPGDLDEI